MPLTESVAGAARPSAADIDTQIRALATGRVVWTPEALREWQQLTRAWAAASREAIVQAA